MIFIINLKYKVGQIVFIKNEVEALDLQCIKNKKLYISEIIKSNNFDYEIMVDGVSYKVREKEIISLEEVENVFKVNDKVETPEGIGIIRGISVMDQEADVYLYSKGVERVFYLHELKLFKMDIDNYKRNVKMSYFQELGLETGKLVDGKQKAYGNSFEKAFELLKVFLKDYKNDDNTYTISESLLEHILLQVRIIDKQNRIFSNPDGDLMQENPYQDMVGYSMLGVKMCDENS